MRPAAILSAHESLPLPDPPGAPGGETSCPERLKLACARAQRIAELGERLARFLAGNRSRHVVLELCCGHGHFLAGFAAHHPESVCIGVDYCRDRIARAQRKQSSAGLGNLQFLRAEVFEFLSAWPAGRRVSSVFLLFPDPWPKRRHRKYRVLSERLLTRLAEICEPRAALSFRTDSEDYIGEALRLAGAHPEWLHASDAAWPYEQASVFQEKADRYFSLIAIRPPSAKE